MDRAPVRAAPAGDLTPSPTPDGGPASRAPAGAERLRRHNWWGLVGAVYAVGAYMTGAILIAEPFGALTVGSAVAAAVAALGAGRLLHRRFPGKTDATDGDDSFPVGWAGLAVAGGLALTVGAQWSFSDAPWALVPGLAAGGVAVTVARRHRIAVLVGAALVTAGVAAAAQYAANGSVDAPGLAGHAAFVALLGGFVIYGLWTCGVVERLDQARRLEGELAVADERLRFAADLHDIQGHHLQVIALKSELAARLAEADPTAAGQHMREVEEHARSALQDTRAVVQGYRSASLGAELANATGVLAAAGIDGRLDGRTNDAVAVIPEAQRNLLGLVAREATTNILRHSHAACAHLALDVGDGWAVLRVRNDGAAAAKSGTGTGLDALADRFDAHGGSLQWQRDEDWFSVTARLPATEDV